MVAGGYSETSAAASRGARDLASGFQRFANLRIQLRLGRLDLHHAVHCAAKAGGSTT
jgi:hypothetical protein